MSRALNNPLLHFSQKIPLSVGEVAFSFIRRATAGTQLTPILMQEALHFLPYNITTTHEIKSIVIPF